MTNFKNRAKRYHQEIQRILLNEWDPIGVKGIHEARDEYDSYVSNIHSMLIRRACENEIFEYLWYVETEHMGLKGNRQQTMHIAKRLIELINEIEKDQCETD